MVNKVILMGNVGKDPEVRRLENNLVVARLPMATSERWNRDGNWVDHTEWHNIVLWRGLAERAEKYVSKGTQIYVEGRLRSRSYDDKDGVKRYFTEILADVMFPIGPKSDKDKDQQRQEPQTISEPVVVAPVDPIDSDSGATDDLPF